MFKNLFPAFACLFFILHQAALAQTDFREGYLVTHAHDTLTGWVDNRSEFRNARQCEFKTAPAAEPVRYEPKDILGYGFKMGKMFESRELTHGTPTPVTERVFLELLVKGTASLYHFKEDGRYYVEKGAHGLIGLYKTDKLINFEGKTRIIEQKQYIGILSLVMNDCPALNKKIRKASLEFKPLVDLVAEYNQCNTTAPSVKTNRTFIIVKGGMLGGVQRSSVRFSNLESGYNYLNGPVFPASTSPFGGLYLQTTLPWVTERFSLWWELHHVRTGYAADHTWKVGYEWNPVTRRTVRDEINLSFSALRLPVLVRYTYPRGKVRPFVQAGAMADYLLGSGSSTVRETEQVVSSWNREDKTYVYTSYEPAMEMRRTNYYAVLATGLEHRFAPRLRWFAELRGAAGKTMIQPSTTPQYGANTLVFALLAGFGF